MAAAAGGDAGAGIGTRLRAAREKKGLTVLQAAERMHVDSRILEALEAEDFAALGAAVYVKGHLRHYAELLGEPPAELVELYSASTHAARAQPDLTRISRPLPDTDPGKLGGPAVVVVVTVAIVGTLWWLISSSGGEKPQLAVVQSNTTAEHAGVADQPAAGVAKANPAEASSPAAPKPTSSAQPRAPAAVSKATVVAQSATPPAAAVTTTTTPAHATPASTLAATSAPPLARPNPTKHAKDAELTLKFSADSWAEVYDAAGRRLFYDVGAASSAHTVKGPAPLRIVLGNASGVSLEYNGRPAPIPSGVLPDGTVRFVITARGRTAPATDGD